MERVCVKIYEEKDWIERKGKVKIKKKLKRFYKKREENGDILRLLQKCVLV